jgi:hypothetical protein
MSAKKNSTTSTANNSPRVARTTGEQAHSSARDIAAYFSECRPEDDRAAGELAALVTHLLHDSPGRARLAHDLYLACARALDALREENGDRHGIYSTDDERERTAVQHHAALIDALTPKQGEQGKRAAQPARGPVRTQDEYAQQLADLRARLRKLEDGPSNEAARFQLLTEIYRLEHRPDGDDILSAEFING